MRFRLLLPALVLAACSTPGGNAPDVASSPTPAEAPSPTPTPVFEGATGAILTPSVLRAAIAEHPEVLGCLDDYRASSKPDLGGEVRVRLLITAAGTVSSASLPDHLDTDLGTCMAGAVLNAKLPKIPEERQATYAMPIAPVLEQPKERLRPKEIAARVGEAVAGCEGASGLTLGLSIDEHGRVASVVPIEADKREGPLAQCLRSAVGQLRFAPPLKGKTTVAVPLP